MENNWMNDPSLSKIDPAKIALLQSFASQGNGMNKNEMMNLLMEASGVFQKKGMNFTPDETDAIVNVLTAGKSPQETAKIQKMISLIKMMKR